MINISRIYLHHNYNAAVLIRWDVADTAEELSNFVFNVYTSLSPDKEFTQVNDAPIEELEYLYEEGPRLDSSVKLYFKVEACDLTTGETSLSDATGAVYLTPTDEIAETIIYQYNIFLQHVLGRPPVKLLIKRRSGTRCPACWDVELGEVTKSSCSNCYSVGYANGYMPPKDIYISFTEPGFATKFDIGDVRDVQQGVTQAWCLNYPLVLPGDVIVDEFNRRFRIIQVQPTTRSGQIYLRQMLQLQLIPPTDVIYNLEIEHEM